MHSPNDPPAKSILKSGHSSVGTYNIHLKRASFKDDPILIQFTEQATCHSPSVEEAETTCGRYSEGDTPNADSYASSSAFTFAVPPPRVFERRKSFEEKRKEFYEEDGIDIRSVLARPPKELFLADEEGTSADVDLYDICEIQSTSGMKEMSSDEGADDLGCRLEKMEVSTSCDESCPLPPPHHFDHHQTS